MAKLTKREQLELILYTIRKFQNGAEFELIWSEVKKRSEITKEFLQQSLDEWVKDGTLYNPVKYQINREPCSLNFCEECPSCKNIIPIEIHRGESLPDNLFCPQCQKYNKRTSIYYKDTFQLHFEWEWAKNYLIEILYMIFQAIDRLTTTIAPWAAISANDFKDPMAYFNYFLNMTHIPGWRKQEILNSDRIMSLIKKTDDKK